MPLRYSIVIPHKNRLSLLIKLVNSIPVREDLEIIVIDDASERDVLSDLEKSAKEMSISIFSNPGTRSKGAGWARNMGIENAQGEYILFADSDDYFRENAFTVIDEEINKSESDLIIFKSDSVDEYGNASSRTNYSNFLIDFALDLQLNSDDSLGVAYRKILTRIDAPWSKLFKRSLLIDRNIKFEEIHFSNDVLFNAMVAAGTNSITFSPNTIYVAMDHQQSLVHNYSEESLDQRFHACLRFNQFVIEQGISTKSMSVTAGYIRRAKQFGLKKMINMWKQSRKARVSIIYPIHRYIVSILLRIFGYNSNQVRFYTVFGTLDAKKI